MGMTKPNMPPESKVFPYLLFMQATECSSSSHVHVQICNLIFCLNSGVSLFLKLLSSCTVCTRVNEWRRCHAPLHFSRNAASSISNRKYVLHFKNYILVCYLQNTPRRYCHKNIHQWTTVSHRIICICTLKSQIFSVKLLSNLKWI